MIELEEFVRRKAPYAPISALREFFERIRDVSVPTRVDRRFLQRLNIASNNEWALLSSLKFLGVIDDEGVPSPDYRSLQATDRFEETLGGLVLSAYRPLLESGGLSMSTEDLQNYFRVTSSPSQAKNAARFFREVCRLAGVHELDSPTAEAEASPDAPEPAIGPGQGREVSARESALLEAKVQLLAKLPAPRPEWTAAEYQGICDRFLKMLEHLEHTS
ncbi:MAG: DUF5343 domain-containing protein [Chloroflexi bacterium]|nr:DUF5343 domain-containing protein [Chloroflexota bacterium]